MKESPLYPVGVPPAKSMMQAHEVLAWIAFRRAVPFEQFACLFNGEPDIWSGSPQNVVLWALEARAGLSDDLNGRPCYAVCYPTREDPDCIPSGHPVLTRQGPRILRFLRALYRKNSGRLMTFADVARLHREKLSEDKVTRMHLDAAKRVLRDKAAGGLLTAYGLPHGPKGEHLAGAMVQPLPETIFMHPGITFTEWNGIGSDPTFAHDEVLRLKLPRFEAIQFKTLGVLKLWPAETSASAASLPEEVMRVSSKVDENIWAETIGAWVPIASVLARVKRELPIDLNNAAELIREGVESFRIRTRLPAWQKRQPFLPGAITTEFVHTSPTGFSATELGATNIEWKTGTLEECEVQVFWADVRRHLRELGSAKVNDPAPERGRPPKGAGGAPLRHDWDLFWIEVTIWAAREDLEASDRVKLQKHMEDWTARNMDPAPDQSAIRRKIAALYKAAADQSRGARI